MAKRSGRVNVDSEEEASTILVDSAEIRAEERRGGAGGPAALGRRRGQHRSPLSFLLLPLRSRDLLPLLLPAYSSGGGGGGWHSRGAREIWLSLSRSCLSVFLFSPFFFSGAQS